MDNNNILNNIKKIVDENKNIKKIINEKNELIRQKDELIRQKDEQIHQKNILINENNNNGITQHKMKVHLRHTQDWSYRIRYNIFQNKSHSGTGFYSPGVIEGMFPRHKIPYIKKIDIINVKNTLTIKGRETKPAGKSYISVDIKGNLITETPHGTRGGKIVTWDSYIDIIILFEDKKKK